MNKPHKPISPSTIARWLKTILSKAGVDTEIFKAHSVQSASTSAAAMAGITTEDILKAADWSSETVFQKFYHKPVRVNKFGRAASVIQIAATLNAINIISYKHTLICETEPSEVMIMNLYHELGAHYKGD